jgi:hypothetical protein
VNAGSRSSTRRLLAVGPGVTGLLDQRPVGGRVEQRVELGRVGHLHHEDPPRPVGVGVHLLGGVVEGGVHLDDRAGDGRVDLRHRLGRLDLGAAGVGHHVGAHPGQLHVDDVTERVLREVGDADARPRALDRDPLVLLAVLQLVGEVHGAGR